MYKQKTLKSSFSLSGKGLHTGLELTVTFNPAPADYGYKIQRTDLESQPVIEAFAENVRETQRGTVLFKGNVKVSTVEHGLAALYAAGIDNCHIEVNGPEFPILDGSAIEYVENIQRVGIKELDALKAERDALEEELAEDPEGESPTGKRFDTCRFSPAMNRLEL